MVNLEKLQKKELDELIVDEEISELEQLIVQGTDAKIYIQVDYPVTNENGETEYTPVTAMIRPLNNVEASTAQQKGINSNFTTANIEMVKMGLFTKDGKQFPPKLVEAMPSGVVDSICTKILEISGIKVNTDENIDMVKKLMGF